MSSVSSASIPSRGGTPQPTAQPSLFASSSSSSPPPPPPPPKLPQPPEPQNRPAAQIPSHASGAATRESSCETARARLAQLLRYPDDLGGKLDSLRLKFLAEKAAVDAQLKAGTQGQLDDCELGLANLSASRSALADIRANFSSIVFAGDKSVAMVSCFPRVLRLSLVHSNFLSTHNVIERFQALSARVEHLSSLLDAHLANLLGPAPDLLLLHYECYHLDVFRRRTLEQVALSSRDVQASVLTYFRRLDTLLASFRNYLAVLARHLLPLLEADQPSVIVRLAKIIDFEERAANAPPSLASSFGYGLNVMDNMPRSLGATSSQQSSRSASQNAINEQPLTNARSSFFDSVHESIGKKFALLLETHKEDFFVLLENTLVAVVDDLTVVFDRLVPLMPKKYKVFPFFVLGYHRHVYDMLNKIILERMETGTILHILRWSREYYIAMQTKLGIGQELLEPRLLDGQEAVLIEDYLKLIASKLDEWMRNLLASESKEFTERSHPPETDAEGAYALSSAVILFNMVNQQIDVAMDSSHGALLLDVVKACVRTLSSFQTHFAQLAQLEYSRFAADPSKSTTGLLEYTMALANDTFKSNEFIDLISNRMDAEADERVRVEIASELTNAAEGFLRLGKVANSILIDAAFADLRSAFALLFTTPAWYQGEVMHDIIATLHDYCVDYSQHMHEYLFGKLVTDMMDRFLILWIESLKSKNARFKVPACWNIVETDIRLVHEFFGRFKSSKRVEKHFLIIDKLLTIVCSNKKMMFLDFYALWKLYNDVPLPFIDDLLSKREDMDKAAVRETMDSIRQKTKEEHPPDSQKSIFSIIATMTGK